VEELPGWIDPCRGLAALGGARHPVLLLSGQDGHPEARHSILSADPLLVAAIRDGEAVLRRFEGTGTADETVRCPDPFEFLRTLAPDGAVRGAPGLPFAGGAIGYLGYGLRHAVEDIGPRPPDGLRQPDAWFGLYDAAVVFDHRTRRMSLVAAGLGAADEGRRRDLAATRLRRLRDLLERGEGAASDARTGCAAAAGAGAVQRSGPEMEGRADRLVARAVTPRDDYLARVVRALGYIASGDIYQVNLSHRIEVPFEGDPIRLFAALARRNPAPFAAYLDASPLRIVSASPERFLSLDGRRVVSGPIKGTRPRSRDAAEDARLAAELQASAKDRAENVMIADLVRSDLGRVCATGSVVVEKLCALESFATVHHLVSTVSGELRRDRDRFDALRGLFPGGSMTGAPKVRAMQIIDELEGEERGVYAGGIGYLSLDGRVDFNIVIRTLVLAAGRAHLRVGGGIVADSDPEAEYRETLDKAQALLDVLQARLET
jgi:para-aminobenzoate synthetase component 1